MTPNPLTRGLLCIGDGTRGGGLIQAPSFVRQQAGYQPAFIPQTQPRFAPGQIQTHVVAQPQLFSQPHISQAQPQFQQVFDQRGNPFVIPPGATYKGQPITSASRLFAGPATRPIHQSDRPVQQRQSQQPARRVSKSDSIPVLRGQGLGGAPAPSPPRSNASVQAPLDIPKPLSPAAMKDTYSTGIKLQEVTSASGRQLQVIRLTNGSSAALCGMISTGDSLARIDDYHIDSNYDALLVRQKLSGERGSRVSLGFTKPHGTPFDVVLVRNVKSVKKTTEVEQIATTDPRPLPQRPAPNVHATMPARRAAPPPSNIAPAPQAAGPDTRMSLQDLPKASETRTRRLSASHGGFDHLGPWYHTISTPVQRYEAPPQQVTVQQPQIQVVPSSFYQPQYFTQQPPVQFVPQQVPVIQQQPVPMLQQQQPLIISAQPYQNAMSWGMAQPQVTAPQVTAAVPSVVGAPQVTAVGGAPQVSVVSQPHMQFAQYQPMAGMFSGGSVVSYTQEPIVPNQSKWAGENHM